MNTLKRAALSDLIESVAIMSDALTIAADGFEQAARGVLSRREATTLRDVCRKMVADLAAANVQDAAVLAEE